MTSVSRHSSHVLASAGFGYLPGHVHGIRQCLGRDDDFGDHDEFVAPADLLLGDERKSPAPAADVFDISKARNENIRNSEHFQQLWLLVHFGFGLRSRPREDLASATYETICTSRSPFLHAKLGRCGYQSMKGLVPATGNGLAQIPDERSGDNGRHGSADHDAALGLAVSGSLKVDEADDAQEVIAHFQVNALAEDALHHDGLGQWRGQDHLSHISSPNGFGGRA